MVSATTPGSLPGWLALEPGQEARETLFAYFAQFVVQHYANDIAAYRWGS